MESLTEWLKILISNYPFVKLSVNAPIKNLESLISQQAHLLSSSSSSSSSPYVKNMKSISFSSLLSSTPSLLLHAQVCILLLSYFFFSVFFISILYEFVFLSLLIFTCNYIKVKKKILLFSMFFSLYLFFILFLIVFVLNNCMNVVVGFLFFHMRLIFSWFIYRIFKFFSYEFF